MPGYGAYRLAAFLSRHLPGRSAYWVGLRIADLFYLFCRRDRAGVQANLEQIYRWRGVQPATRNVAGMVRKTYQYFGKYMVDFFRFSRLSRAELDRLVSIEHPERLTEAFAAGRGVIVVTAHFGNWELGGAVLHALDYPVNAVVLPQRMARLNRLLEDQRKRRGIHVVPLGHSALSLVRCLKRGEVVALLADRDFTRHHQTLDFFGRPARLPVGAAWLSRQTGAPILPAFLLRQEDDTFLLHLHPPLWPDQASDVDSTMIKLRDILQAEIGERPYQWFIFHDFWAGESVPGASTGDRST